ncbi:MAG TPA: hypothetical protein VKC89_02655 [Patescibacteria group bacterium]|nr:hypothetical protein [Patescibacteria group bacterium]
MPTNYSDTLIASLNNALLAITLFVPKFLAGLVILLIGIVIASILKRVVVEVFKTLKIEAFLKKYGVPEMREEFTWTNILSEIVRWFVIVIFLIPTAEIWGLSRITGVLNDFLLYLPNVFVAAVIALVGFVFARLTHDVILVSAKGVDTATASTIASVARWSVNVFVLLAVLSQLGVATDLIRILFTGFVAMLAVAGGIAFGLGGQGAAKEVVEGVKRRLK